jgi:hypothetical protein
VLGKRSFSFFACHDIFLETMLAPETFPETFLAEQLLTLPLTQAVGGGFAGGAGNNVNLRNIGTNLMISGIVWQVATLIAFAGLVIDYIIRTRRAWNDVTPEAKSLLKQRKFRGFLAAVAVAFVTVFLRCVYRIAEMVGGWANPIMRDEIGFDVMEGMCVTPSQIQGNNC